MMNRSPIISRSFVGKVILPLTSIVWLYVPLSIQVSKPLTSVIRIWDLICKLRHCSPLFCTFNHCTLIIHYNAEKCNSNFSQNRNQQGIFLGHFIKSAVFLWEFCNLRSSICHKSVTCKLFVNYASYNMLIKNAKNFLYDESALKGNFQRFFV